MVTIKWITKIVIFTVTVLLALYLIVPFALSNGYTTSSWQSIDLPNKMGSIKVPSTWDIVSGSGTISIYEDDSHAKLLLEGSFESVDADNEKMKKYKDLNYLKTTGGMNYSNSSYSSTFEYKSEESDDIQYVQFIALLNSTLSYPRYVLYSVPNSIDSETARRIAQSYSFS